MTVEATIIDIESYIQDLVDEAVSDAVSTIMLELIKNNQSIQNELINLIKAQISYDGAFDSTSTNAVQNKVITAELDDIKDKLNNIIS